MDCPTTRWCLNNVDRYSAPTMLHHNYVFGEYGNVHQIYLAVISARSKCRVTSERTILFPSTAVLLCRYPLQQYHGPQQPSDHTRTSSFSLSSREILLAAARGERLLLSSLTSFRPIHVHDIMNTLMLKESQDYARCEKRARAYYAVLTSPPTLLN